MSFLDVHGCMRGGCVCIVLAHLYVCSPSTSVRVCVSLYASAALAEEVARLLLTDDK